MARTQNLTVRLAGELINKIEEEARYEKTDKSTVARRLIAAGIEQVRERQRPSQQHICTLRAG